MRHRRSWRNRANDWLDRTVNPPRPPASPSPSSFVPIIIRVQRRPYDWQAAERREALATTIAEAYVRGQVVISRDLLERVRALRPVQPRTDAMSWALASAPRAPFLPAAHHEPHRAPRTV